MKKLIFRSIKWAVFLLAIYFIYTEVFAEENKSLFPNFVEQLRGENLKILLLIFSLMGVNWLLEAIKWKYLIYQAERITLNKSIRSILNGIYLSMITPNRVGDGIGKIEGLRKRARSRGAFAFMVGGMSQLIATSLFGTIALWLAVDFKIFGKEIWLLIKIGISTITLALLIAYYYPKWREIFSRLIDKVTKKSSVINYSVHQLNSILSMSMIRYVIFSFQFYLALQFFGVEIQVLHAVFCIGITYLFSTWIPSFLLGELGIRESVAIAVFGIVTENIELVFLSSLMVWTINLLIPGIIGMVLFTFGKKRK